MIPQECQSLESGEPHDTQKSGVLYVPSKGKCVSITNQSNPKGPYYTTLTTCGKAYAIAYAQRWVIDEANSNAIRWVSPYPAAGLRGSNADLSSIHSPGAVTRRVLFCKVVADFSAIRAIRKVYPPLHTATPRLQSNVVAHLSALPRRLIDIELSHEGACLYSIPRTFLL